MTIFSPANEMTITLLLYPNDAPEKRWAKELDESEGWETHQNMFLRGSRP